MAAAGQRPTTPPAAGIETIGHDGDGASASITRSRASTRCCGRTACAGAGHDGEWLDFMADGAAPRRRCGCRTVLPPSRRKAGTRRVTRATLDGAWFAMTSAGCAASNRRGRFVTSAITKPTMLCARSGRDLPSEGEWESWPKTASSASLRRSLQWTRSAYSPYPDYRAVPGALGEIPVSSWSTKWCCAARRWRRRPAIRASRIASFYPSARWQLARMAACGIPTLSVAMASSRANRAARGAVDRGADRFAADVLAGLRRSRNGMPPVIFQRFRRPALFSASRNCREYYPTRCELALLRRHAPAIASRFPASLRLDRIRQPARSKKARILLCAAATVEGLRTGRHFRAACAGRGAVAARFPAPCGASVVADFTQGFDIPLAIAALPRVGFFRDRPSAIFEPQEGGGILRHAGDVLGVGAVLVIGVDLVKDPGFGSAAQRTPTA